MYSLKRERSAEPEDMLWEQISPDLKAFQSIITRHLGVAVLNEQAMNHGAYARVFLYSLENQTSVIGRIILPARGGIKTEAEIAARDSLRGEMIYLPTFPTLT